MKDFVPSFFIVFIMWVIIALFYYAFYLFVGGRLMVAIFAGLFLYNNLKDWVKLSIKVWNA